MSVLLLECVAASFFLSLLGGGVVILPGTLNDSNNVSIPFPTPESTRSVDVEPSESLDGTTDPLPFTGAQPKGSGPSYYASEDLITVRFV